MSEKADLSPITVKGEPYFPMVQPENSNYPVHLGQSATPPLIERILSNPAPLPVRDVQPLMRKPEPIFRQALAGANEMSTPHDRAVAALIRSLPICVVIVFSGIVAIFSGLGDWVVVATVVAVLLVMGYYSHQEYKHSQPGVERQRSKEDHKLAILHESNRANVELTYEENRHAETMAAIEADTAIKMQVLGIAHQYARLSDKKGVKK